MKTRYTYNWLRLVSLAITILVQASTPCDAQDETRNGSDELYRHMYEGGLITQDEYEYASREGRLPGGTTPQTKAGVSTEAENTASVFNGEEAGSGKQTLHRRLDADGRPVTVEQFRAAKRESLAARTSELFERQRAEKRAALDAARAGNLPIRVEQKDGSVTELMAVRDGHPVYYTTYNIKSADTIGTDEIWPSGSLGLSLSGTNRMVGMWDGNAVRTTHVEFVSGGICRLSRGDNYTNFIENPHPTQVAGTLVAGGVNTNARGMSFESHLLTYEWTFDTAEMAGAAISNDLRISNHSYGRNTGWNIIYLGAWYWIWYGDVYVNTVEDYKFGFYSTNESREIDQTVYEASTYLPVWASGNEKGGYNLGPATQPAYHLIIISNVLYSTTTLVHNADGAPNGYDLIPPQGAAKNVLTVGVVSNVAGGFTSPTNVYLAPFSSVGPTDDGRIKPDVVAQGVNLFTTYHTNDTAYQTVSGTSFASPSVAGSLNLLQQLYDNLRGTNRALLASTLKGLAIHTADDCGPVGPDYSFGWGLMNTRAAAQLITNDLAGDGHAHIKEVALPSGEAISFPILATNNQPLKVTVVWTDPPGPMLTPSVDPTNLVLINDLDLRLISPTGTTNMPWVLNPSTPTNAATTGDNFRDNVEQVYIAAPTNGVYTVQVTHKGALSNGWQDVSILLSGNLPMEKAELELVRFHRDLAPTNTLEWPSVVGQFYRLQSSTNLMEDAWTDITGDISALRTNVIFGTEADPTPEIYFYRVNEVP